MLILKSRALLIIGLTLASSCSQKHELSERISAVDSLTFVDSTEISSDTIFVAKPLVDKDRLLDNMGRFIAGMQQEDSTSFSALESEVDWTEYKSSMDTNWNRVYRERLALMREWQGSTFSPAINDTLRVFYPFSGPDFLHAYYLYPRATEYILAALEPIVEIPSLDTLTVDVRDKFLDSLGNSLRDIFKKSYFITTHMKRDLKQIKGVLPPLLFFLERSGHELLEMKFVTLDSTGAEKEIEARKLNGIGTPGVRITFRNRDDLKIKKLYYFSISISNGGLEDRPEFLRFMARKAPFNTFVKSASYLMHNSPFTKIKELILTTSQSLFQDDTGVPYKDFKRQLNLSLQFYGEYTRPVKDFDDKKFQPDLDSAFKASKHHEALPFLLGYHWGSKKQNYMLAKKQTVRSAK